MRTHAEIEAAHQRRAKRAQKREAKQRRRHVQRERQRQQRARCLRPGWESQGQAHRHELRGPEQDADDHDATSSVPPVPQMQHGLQGGPMALAQVGGAIARHEADARVAGARARRQANAEIAVKARQQRDRRQRQTVIEAVEERWLRRREAAQEERAMRTARRREQEDAHRAAQDLMRAALMYKA